MFHSIRASNRVEKANMAIHIVDMKHDLVSGLAEVTLIETMDSAQICIDFPIGSETRVPIDRDHILFMAESFLAETLEHLQTLKAPLGGSVGALASAD
jgi:hypothetical protein